MAPIRSVSELDPSKTYTYADYLTWQLGEWVELLRGKLVRRMSPALTRLHQLYSSNLHFLLRDHLRRQPCQVYAAPFDVRLTTHGANGADEAITTVVQPDLCVICDRTKLDDRGCLGAPNWVIEILSPGTAARDMHDKFDLYEESGVGEYWIVAPMDRNISVFVLDATTGRYRTVGDYATPGPVPSHTLPEMVLEWEDVWAE